MADSALATWHKIKHKKSQKNFTDKGTREEKSKPTKPTKILDESYWDEEQVKEEGAIYPGFGVAITRNTPEGTLALGLKKRSKTRKHNKKHKTQKRHKKSKKAKKSKTYKRKYH
jgi:hypothetical protein